MRSMFAYLIAGCVLLALGGNTIASRLDASPSERVAVFAFAAGILLLARMGTVALEARLRALESKTSTAEGGTHGPP